MRKLLLLLLIAPLFVFGQKHKKVQRQAFDLPRVNGKITYLGRAIIQNGNFERSAKVALSMYASYYNGRVEQESNKMKDYIAYEDSVVIVAQVRFLVNQSLKQSIFSAKVSYEKDGTAYKIKATDFKIDKQAQQWAGYQSNMSASIDDWNPEASKRMFTLMQNEVEKLFNYSFNP